MRFTAQSFSDTLLRSIASELQEKTAYLRTAPKELAPEQTDCLTSIHYIFKKALAADFPVTFIGDMPRTLSSLAGWEFTVLKSKEEIRAGDLYFVGKVEKTRLISHVALFLSQDELFHCTQDHSRAIVEDFATFQTTYEQKVRKQQIRYIDFRNESLRQQHSGCYMKC